MKTDRRKFIQNFGVGTVALGIGVSPAVAKEKSPMSSDDQVLFVGDNIAVASTTYGKVRGFILRVLTHFLGIPYGADTSGANRFMPPQKPVSWT